MTVIWYCPNLPPYPSTIMAYGEPAVMLTYTDRQVVCTNQIITRCTVSTSSQLLPLETPEAVQQYTVGMILGANTDPAQNVGKSHQQPCKKRLMTFSCCCVCRQRKCRSAQFAWHGACELHNAGQLTHASAVIARVVVCWAGCVVLQL